MEQARQASQWGESEGSKTILQDMCHPHHHHHNKMMNPLVHVQEDVVTLLGWPTDVVKIQPQSQSPSSIGLNHRRPIPTILFFVPGNPGCIGWYISTLSTLVHRMGNPPNDEDETRINVVAAYGISYAGHSPHPDRTRIVATPPDDKSTQSYQRQQQRHERPIQVAWTIEGQVQHKIAFYDHVMKEYTTAPPNHQSFTVTTKTTPSSSSPREQQQQSLLPQIIWISHSIGGHMVERILMLRKDILQQTKGVLHLMPFIRMKTLRRSDQYLLDWAAARPTLVIALAQLLLRLAPFRNRNTTGSSSSTTTSTSTSQEWLEHRRHIPILMEESEDQQLAMDLLRQPWFARNFFELGLEEIRDVGQGIDVPALQYILKHCPIAMLYAGKDHWGPQFHVDELGQLQPQLLQPNGGVRADYGLHLSYRPDLRHDYVSYTHMKETVADWCHQHVTKFQRVPSVDENHAPPPAATPPTATSHRRSDPPRHSKL